MAGGTKGSVLVCGGAGYVGSKLVFRLATQGYRVFVFDTFWFGPTLPRHPNIFPITYDMRERPFIPTPTDGSRIKTVIHLACISNDPCFDLNPALARAVNFECFEPFVACARERGVERFIYASSSSVYGISDAERVTEDHPLNPLTDYSRYKIECEKVLLRYQRHDFHPVIVRPATVCGTSPRMRFDLIVNLLTRQAIETGVITIHSETNCRTNIHIDDLCRLYEYLVERPLAQVSGQIFNAGGENMTLLEIAHWVALLTGAGIILKPTATDGRSYRITSWLVERKIGFRPEKTVADAISDICGAVRAGSLSTAPSPLTVNIERMRELGLG